jgi:hypothetical protein
LHGLIEGLGSAFDGELAEETQPAVLQDMARGLVAGGKIPATRVPSKMGPYEKEK